MIIRILAFSLVVFALLRIALFGVYRDYFDQANVWAALWQGTRFDMRLLVLVFAPFLLILLLPYSQLNTLKLRRFSAWACFTLLLILTGVAIANIAYFGEVKRHLGGEILNIGNDLAFIVQTAFGSRIAYTIAGGLFLLIMFWAYKKTVISATNSVSSSLKKRFTFSVLQILLLVLMARGMVLSGKPLNSVDAFQNGNQAQANLTLNGTWIALQEIRQRQNQQPLNYLNSDTYQKIATENPQPFVHHSTHKPSGKNVVFILLESWSYRYIDALSGNQYGVTPHTDKLISKSQVWTQFYAAGQRSIIGIQAALTSVPALPEREPLGFGLELNKMSRIAELANRRGYRTIMAQSSKRRSFHMDGIAKSLGFQEYFGQEDVPLLRDYPQDTPPFGWDYDTLQFFGKQISQQAEKPFFAFLFTGTTHEPFANVDAEFTKYPHDNKGENGFLNTLAYSDWALHQFMKYAEQQSWYNNTIFVFTADHTLNAGAKPTDVKQLFHIPLIVFDPSNPVGQRHDELSSQYDLLPTFADILGVNEPVSTFGKSLWQKEKVLPITLNQGSISSAIFPNGSTAQFQGQNAISGSLNTPEAQFLQFRMQKADELLRQNAWAK
ncbi:MAG: LTA synthase family protein [Alysiella sp.]|uniref:LTA synthase family protein n=1 Tax=Alysiella sp. TaxID=1872483 RepID=UPI0026DAD2A4|nr:LTA synthase family protein [Alysiella sp.]MDO4433488.1 LTA synthase family protein [Alysiella sp.]